MKHSLLANCLEGCCGHNFSGRWHQTRNLRLVWSAVFPARATRWFDVCLHAGKREREWSNFNISLENISQTSPAPCCSNTHANGWNWMLQLSLIVKKAGAERRELLHGSLSQLGRLFLWSLGYFSLGQGNKDTHKATLHLLCCTFLKKAEDVLRKG